VNDSNSVVCSWCKLSAKSAGEIKHVPPMGYVCWECESKIRMSDRILQVLAAASACRMNQRSIASKLGFRPTEINRGLSHLSRLKLIERALSNPNLERPSAITYQLRDHVGGRGAIVLVAALAAALAGHADR
jgi:hypothetical protein